MSWKVRGLLVLSVLMVAVELAAQEIHELEGPVLTAGRILSVFKLASTGEHLSPNIQTSFQQANQEFSQLRRELRSGGGSTSSSNGDWRVQIRAANGTGLYSYGLGRSGRISGLKNSVKPEFHALLQEYESPHRELLVTAESDGSFLIQLRSQSQPYLFRLRQHRQKQITCCEIRADAAFSARAETFDQFCRQHFEFVEHRLMPILKAIGAGAPTTRFSPIVQEFVIRQLRPAEPLQIAKFNQAIDGLDGTDFEQRQRVTQEITEQYEQWQHLIQRVVGNTEYPVEVRSRLRKILESQISGEEREKMELALSAELSTDVDYLVWLWAQLRNKATAQQDPNDESERLIQSRLQLLTNQKLGEDLGAWQKWWQSQALPDPQFANAAEATLSDQLLGSLGPLDAARNVLDQLIEFKIENRDLVLDRDRWNASFDGKSIKVVNEEVASLLQANNLPAAWYQPGGSYSLEFTDHPQVIFESLAEVLGPDIQDDLSVNRLPPRRINSFNRQIDCDSVFTRLEFHPRTVSEIRAADGFRIRMRIPPRQDIKRDYFSFFFREKVAPHRCLEVRETAENELVICLMSEANDAIVRLFQASRPAKGSRARLWLTNNGTITTLEADDFAGLIQSNQSYFLGEVATLFEPLGIRFKTGQPGSRVPINQSGKPTAKR